MLEIKNLAVLVKRATLPHNKVIKFAGICVIVSIISFMAEDRTVTLLQRLFALVHSAAGRHAIFAGIADSGLAILESDGIAVFEYDDVQDSFSLATARNLSLEAQVQVMGAINRCARADRAWRTQLQLVGDWEPGLEAEAGAAAPDLRGLKGLVSVPLRSSKGQPLALLAAFYRDPAAITPRRQILASLLGDMAALALENVLLHEVERHRADFLGEVLRVGEHLIQTSQPLGGALQQVAQIIADTLGWQTVVIVLFDFEERVRCPVAWACKDPAFNMFMEQAARGNALPLDDPLPWRRAELRISRSYFSGYHMQESAQAVCAVEGNGGRERPGQGATRPTPNCWHPDDFLIVPLLYNGVDLGWISVDTPADGRCPDVARVQELEVFADQVALAVINSRLYTQAEQERLKLATVLDGITDGVLAFDVQWRLMFANRAAEQLLGMTLPQVPGASMETVLVDSPLLDFLEEAEDGQARSGEVALPHLRRVLFVNLTPLPSTGFVVVMRDVTYFHEMERLRLELLSSLSHDLKNPLTAINVTAALIERAGQLNERQRGYVERLRGTAQRAVTMITDLLDMVRLQSGARLSQDLCLLAELIEDVVAEMQVHGDAKGVTLACEAAELPPLRGDTIRLRQALTNLIDNAIKYTPAGGRVVVRATAAAQEVVVAVQDSGIGIAAEHLPHVFDRFYRVDPLSEVEGTGLGLTIVKTVVERHGGRVWVESSEGQGSTFYLALPLAPPTEGA